METAIIKECELIHTAWFGRTDKFTIVDEFPQGAIVWPIGRENFPFAGYIPVVYPKYDPEYPWMQAIDASRKMALKCKSDEIALKALKAATTHGCNKETFESINNG